MKWEGLVFIQESCQVYRNFRVHSAIKITTLLLLDWKHLSIASRPKLLT